MNFLLGASWFSDHAYGLMIGIGMIAAIFLAYFVLKKRGYNPEMVFDIAIICIPIAIIGARIYYVVFNMMGKESVWGDWFNKDLTILGFKRVGGKLSFAGFSGLAVYGGIIFAALAAVFIVRPLNRRKKNPLDQMTIMQMFDLFFIMIILGQGIGRLGCYSVPCCYGRETTCHTFPFAIEYSKDYWVLATFFYEAFFNFIGFGLMFWLYWGKRKSYDGFNFAFYCMWYGLTRFIIEGFRGDSLRLWSGGLRVSQLLSGILILYGIGNVLYHIYMAKKSGKKFFIFVDEKLLDESYYGYEKTIIYLNKTLKKQKPVKQNENNGDNENGENKG